MVTEEMENPAQLYNDEPRTSSSIYALSSENRENLDQRDKI